MATFRKNISIKKVQLYEFNTRSKIRDYKCDYKNFQNASKDPDVQLGLYGSNDNVALRHQIQAPVQDEPQKPVLNKKHWKMYGNLRIELKVFHARINLVSDKF